MSGPGLFPRALTTKARLRLLLVVLMLPLLLQLTSSFPTPSRNTGLTAQTDAPIGGAPLAAKSRPSDPTAAASEQTHGKPAPVWPAASTTTVDVSASAVRAGAMPIYLAAARGVSKVRVQTFDRPATGRAGIDGVLLRLDEVDGAASGGSVRLSLDYDTFASAFGADWAARLRLVSLPECALTTPTASGCGTVTELASINDRRSARVAATVSMTGVSSATKAGGVVLALTAAPKSGDGDYSATSLSASSQWDAGSNSGDFGWSYPIRVPPSLGGPTPPISLTYSAQSVDGHTAASNNQPGWVGEGFDYSPGYIERSYVTCGDDMLGSGHNNTVKSGDECWATDNATVSLNGHSGELIKDGTDPNRWHLRNDDGSLIVRKTGAGNGDDNGEWWVLTSSNGTQYWFGGVPSANSTWTVPVYGNDPNEPCHQAAFAASSCTQAWRWNLDFVVDTHANTMAYTYVKETNKYGRNNSSTDVVGYDRGGYPAAIAYGTRQDVTGPAPMQVLFGVADRCLADCATHDAAHWPDVVWDQDCSAAPCVHQSPTFWSTKRLSTVTTSFWDLTKQPAGYRDVERWTLTHSFPDPGDGTRAGLWLSRIAHVGLDGAITATPDVVFSGVQLQNRVDTQDDQLFPMNWWRISRIDTDTGGAVIVRYAPPECVKGTAMPDVAHLENNTMRCFPVKWTPDGAASAITDFFHKYVVAQIREGDLTGGAPDIVPSYDYVGGGAWRYTEDDGMVKPDDKTWANWRGYSTVRKTDGDAADAVQTLDVKQFFRGMNGDHLPTGSRSVTVAAVDMNGDGDTADPVDVPASPDEDAFSGMMRADIHYNGPGGPEIDATVNEPWQSAPTASRTINGVTVYARFAGTAATHTRTVLDTDGGTRPAGMRTTTSTTTFDSLGMPVEVDDHGDDAVAGDEGCSLTSYARNMNPATGLWLTQLTNRVQQFSVGCAVAKAGGLPDSAIKGDGRTLYDGQTFGAAPTKGDVTELQSLKATGTSPTYVTTSTSHYDAYGRIIDSADVDGNHTTTAYTPASGAPVTQVVTTNALGWAVATKTIDPAYGATSTEVDANNKRTDIAMDGLGRTTSIWMPGQDKAGGQAATETFDYVIRTGGANSVTTHKLGPNGSYIVSISLYDGLLRLRQAQTPDASVANARLVTDTFYDSAGRVWKTTTPYPMTGVPAPDVYVPVPPDYSGPEALPAWAVTLYDGAGRTTATVEYVHNVEKWRTTTVYTGDRTDVIPPGGGTPASTVVDAAGNTVALRQYHGTTIGGPDDATIYSYNSKNQLTRVTDPAGNHWDYQYDLRGREIQVDDPDKGRTTTTYDDAGRAVTVTDSRNTVLAYTYDTIGRQSTCGTAA